MAIVKKNLGRMYCGTLESRHPELGENMTTNPRDLEQLEELATWFEHGCPFPTSAHLPHHKDIGPLIRRAIAAIREKEWQPIETRSVEVGQTYLVANNKGQVAPWIRGIIHNNVGTPWDWGYGEEITHWMPLPLPPSKPSKRDEAD